MDLEENFVPDGERCQGEELLILLQRLTRRARLQPFVLIGALIPDGVT